MIRRGRCLKYIFWLIIILFVLLLLLSIVLLCTSFGLHATIHATKKTDKTKGPKITDEGITLIQTFLGVALMVQGLLLYVTFRLKRACHDKSHEDIDTNIKFWVLLFVAAWGLGFYAAIKFKLSMPTVSLTSMVI